jgi:MFS family permease
MSLGCSGAMPALAAAYLSSGFLPICGLVFLGSFLNSAGNTVFNAALMLALPEENRSAILGFIESASIGGSALSTLLYGLLGDVFPLYLVFAAGTIISLIPMLYLCFHPKTKEFVLNNCG